MQDLADSIATAFDSIITADSRLVRQKLYISWLRQTGASSFGIVGTSTVNNCLVQGEIGVVTPVDTFEFFDESDRALRLEYDRRIEEPLGGISFAIANGVLDNTDNRFTPEYNSTIGTAILPNRPVKMMVGFQFGGNDNVISVFKGLSKTFRESKVDRQVEFSGYDYVSYLNELEMDTTIFVNYRSDQIIEQILIEAGFGSSQYELDEGLNVISFAWFRKGMTAGERIRKICEAEEGFFFQDEYGIIRFYNRRRFNTSPFNSIVWTINDDDILDWKQDESVPVINKCIVRATPREESDKTEIWRDGIVEELVSGETKEIWAVFDNPCVSIDNPVAGVDYIANSASDGTGTNITDDVSISLDAFTESAKLTITNNYSGNAYITFLRLMGTPAVVKSEIQQVYFDEDSIAKYDENVLEIENDFIDNESFARYLAKAIVIKYKDPLKRIRVLVRGIPHLQLMDKVKVYDRDLGEYKNYRVMGIQSVFSLGEFLQWLTLREITSYEADSWAVVGVTTVNSENEFVGI